ncbi:hypothetical protein ACPOL_0236 [Acidisarcina polymorpha]|uniref:Uncharacterized protein n=1 Tax=Acidisarcina polymorpha TaxID=2211140 RepID=A0A2Z5FS67_9BACT|nr:hypothetical protein [Acidisarcina polymorpha]AXC09621.1 hypothetical protein ACPOL_0236 [Acidisarcina polymorpha]
MREVFAPRVKWKFCWFGDEEPSSPNGYSEGLIIYHQESGLSSGNRGVDNQLMRVLYVIFVLCVGALLWAAFAAAGHIRQHEKNATRSAEPKSGDELTENKEVLLSGRETNRDQR